MMNSGQFVCPVLEGGLLAAGICRNMHWEIVHWPLHYQGLGIPSLYTTKGISHLEALLDAPPAEGITGKLLMCLAEDIKVEIGLPSNYCNTIIEGLFIP